MLGEGEAVGLNRRVIHGEAGYREVKDGQSKSDIKTRNVKKFRTWNEIGGIIRRFRRLLLSVVIKPEPPRLIEVGPKVFPSGQLQ